MNGKRHHCTLSWNLGCFKSSFRSPRVAEAATKTQESADELHALAALQRNGRKENIPSLESINAGLCGEGIEFTARAELDCAKL